MFELAGMPFPVGNGALAAVRAGDDRDPLRAGAGDDLRQALDLLLVGIEEERGGAQVRAPVQGVHQQREGRDQRRAMREEDGQILFRHVGAVDDPVEPGTNRVRRRPAGAGVDGAGLAQAVDDLGDGAQVIRADAAGQFGLPRQHVAVARDFDDIHPVLDLAPRLRDHLCLRVAEHREG